MADGKLTIMNLRLGTSAAILGVMSLLSFVAVFLLHNTIGLVLYFAIPALCALAFTIGVVELVRARRGRATWKEALWAQLGLVSSLLVAASWVAFYLWLNAFVNGMQHHR
ncbi:MAG: hypothetical protein JWM21_4492 [Acidobacteria bacterium]|nr:hypothetical protein [Acidobacteriota bacterium]